MNENINFAHIYNINDEIEIFGNAAKILKTSNRSLFSVFTFYKLQIAVSTILNLYCLIITKTLNEIQLS
jgi:hypothetical protein